MKVREGNDEGGRTVGGGKAEGVGGGKADG